MALKPCPQCGKMISDKAEKCPQCGLDIKNFPPEEISSDIHDVGNTSIIEKSIISDNSEPIEQAVLTEKYLSVENPIVNKKKNKTRKWLWFWLCFTWLVGIGAAIWIPIYRHNEKLNDRELVLKEMQRLDSVADVESKKLELINNQKLDSMAAVETEPERLEQVRQDSTTKVERNKKRKSHNHEKVDRREQVQEKASSSDRGAKLYDPSDF